MSLVLVLMAIAADVPAVPVLIDGKPFTEARFDATKPYLHPLRTPSGKIITRVWPMEDAGADKRDHPHHRGLWFSHGDVNGWDFWANEPAQKGVGKGRGVIKATSAKQKKDTVSFTAGWSSPDGVLLKEERVMRFTGDTATRTIDFDIVLTAAQKVVFGDTKEGTFAIRLRDELTEPKGEKMLSSDGAAGEKAIWGKAFPWVDYSGDVEGETVGIAIFDHPQNPRHPTRWHARAYGLFAANIFGLHDFLNDKTKDGSLTLEPGKTIKFRYQVVIHSGDAASAKIADLYRKYAGS